MIPHKAVFECTLCQQVIEMHYPAKSIKCSKCGAWYKMEPKRLAS